MQLWPPLASHELKVEILNLNATSKTNNPHNQTMRSHKCPKESLQRYHTI